MRLKRALRDEDYLGALIEIIYPRSKYSGFRGWVGHELVNGKFRLSLPPATYEQREKNHIFYVKPEDIYKWVNIIKKQN